jgi:hypothetical protein
MITIKNRPCLEGEAEKTEVDIIEEVLKEKSTNTSSSGTFLSYLGIKPISRKSSVSIARIRELEHMLAEQEEQSLLAAERYKQDMDERVEAHDKIFEEIINKKEEDHAALMQARELKNIATEKRQQELEGMVHFLLRTTQQQGHGNNSAAPPF